MRILLGFLVCASVCVSAVGFAKTDEDGGDSTRQSKAASYYASPNGNAFGMPTGGLFLNNQKSDLGKETDVPAFGDFTAPKESTTANVPNNYPGCAGVTQADYTTALFYTSGVFDKFKRDINSDLAKQLLTYNYSLPQTAALFDTLNNYGNAQYQSFVQGCKVNALQQDARQQYINQCVTEELVTKQFDGLKKALQASAGGGNSPMQLTDPQIRQLAYAQAWELCSSMKASPTTPNPTQSDDSYLLAYQKSNLNFMTLLQKSQDVNASIKDMLCTNYNGAAGDLCWQAAFLPQVRVCVDKDMTGDKDKGCLDGEKYGVRAPQVRSGPFFDTLRYIAANLYMKKSFNPYRISIIAEVGQQSLKTAANQTVQLFDRTQDDVAGAGSENSRPDKTVGIATISNPAVLDFEHNYLGCNNHDALSIVREFDAIIRANRNANKGKAVKTSLTAIATTDIDAVVNRMDLGKDVKASDLGLSYVAEAALGCAVNQHIPMFDPNIFVNLTAQCNNNDIESFYTMAGYDASLQATRDVYMYLNSRLKAIRTQLLASPQVPKAVSDSAISPEVNKRLADAIQDVMIPYMEDQLARLDKLNETRSQFARRVQEIYTTKDGCFGRRGVKY
jgi:hypothetical protein